MYIEIYVLYKIIYFLASHIVQVQKFGVLQELEIVQLNISQLHAVLSYALI